jgi:hypothetical protein
MHIALEGEVANDFEQGLTGRDSMVLGKMVHLLWKSAC